MAELLIRQLREGLRLRIEDVSFDAGMSVSQLSRIERGIREPKASELLRIAERLGTTVGALFGEPQPLLIPIVSWVSAGRLWTSDPVRNVDIQRHVAVVDLPRGDWIALSVEGDSMDRIAPPGAVICVNRVDSVLIDRRFYVMSTPSGGATFKRYRADPVRLQPFSTNPDNETIIPTEELLVVGRVHRVIIDVK